MTYHCLWCAQPTPDCSTKDAVLRLTQSSGWSSVDDWPVCPICVEHSIFMNGVVLTNEKEQQ